MQRYIHDFGPTTRDEVAVYVDRYQLGSNSKGVDVRGQARLIKTAAGVLSNKKRLMAVVNQDDKNGINAYGTEGYRLITMNGDRPHSLLRFVSGELQQQAFPAHMVVISSDPAFGPLCSYAARDNTQVSIWTPTTELPEELRDPRFEHRLLSDLIPSEYISSGGVQVWLDIENLLIELKKRGWKYNAETFVKTIDAAVEDLGDVKRKIAYADYGLLTKDYGNLQRDLEKLDVRTRYQVNIRGKNSSDMEIATDIHSAIEREPSLQTVVIGSGDRDFRPTIDVAHTHNRKVVVLAFRDSLSSDLERAADEVRFLDEYFQIQKQTSTSTNVAPSRTQLKQLVSYGYRLHRNKWKWCFTEKLLDIAPMEEWERDVKAGVLHKGRVNGKETLSFNPNNQLAQAVRYFIQWVTARIDYLIRDKVDTGRMTYIDTNYLAKGMEMDSKCKTLGIGQNRKSVIDWLDVAAAVGCVRKESKPHFKNTSHQVDTWWPIDYQVSEDADEKIEALSEAERSTVENGDNSVKSSMDSQQESSHEESNKPTKVESQLKSYH